MRPCRDPIKKYIGMGPRVRPSSYSFSLIILSMEANFASNAEAGRVMGREGRNKAEVSRYMWKRYIPGK